MSSCQGGEHGALGANAGGASRVMKRLQELLQRLVCSAAFESECALAHRREHDFARQDLVRKLSLAEPFEAAQREHQRASISPEASLRIRVFTLPRLGRIVRSGRRRNNWAWRRNEAVPILAPFGDRVQLQLHLLA
jgi:hypothetical protein